MDRETVKVYVRAGGHKGERIISLQPPKLIPQSQWLKRGFAFDGNSVVASVTARTYVNRPSNLVSVGVHTFDSLKPGDEGFVDPEDPVFHWIDSLPPKGGVLPGEWALDWSLTNALTNVQQWLVDWFDKIGYDVEFA